MGAWQPAPRRARSSEAARAWLRLGTVSRCYRWSVPRLAPLTLVWCGVCLAAAPAGQQEQDTKARRTPGPVAELGRGFRAYRDGDYTAAARRWTARRQGLRSRRLGAVSAGARASSTTATTGAARGHFERRRTARGRPAEMAPCRIADCLWMEGDRAKAAAALRRLVKTAAARTGDAALARFRLAEADGRARSRRARASSSWPSRATSRRTRWPTRRCGGMRRAAAPAATRATSPTDPAPTPDARAPAWPICSPADRLRRAESLTKDRHWDEALAELAEAAGDAAPRARRRARLPDRDDEVPHAARLRGRGRAAAGARSPHLSGDKAASAQFHGARALSRVDRDDEAIAGYRKVIAQFPHSRFARRGAVPVGLARIQPRAFPREPARPGGDAGALRRAARSPTTPPGAWRSRTSCSATTAEAAAGFERYGRLPATGMASDEIRRAWRYWRARLHEKAGKKAEAEAAYRELAQRAVLVLRAAGAGAPEAGGPRGAARAAGEEDRRRDAGEAAARAVGGARASS